MSTRKPCKLHDAPEVPKVPAEAGESAFSVLVAQNSVEAIFNKAMN